MAKGRFSTFSVAGLALLGTTCCALPITLVALGAGGAMASLASSAPWLVGLSAYKEWTFGLTALALGYAWWQARRAEACDIADMRRLRWQRLVLRVSGGLFVVSVLASYGLFPLVVWLDL